MTGPVADPNEPGQDRPVDQGAAPASPQTSPPASGAPDTTAAAPPAQTPPVAEPEPLSPSLKARLDALTADKWANHRAAAAAEARARVAEATLADLQRRLGDPDNAAPPSARRPDQPAPQAPPAGVPADEVQRRAEALAAQMRFNERCQEIFNQGVAKHPDFQAKVQDINRLLGGAMPEDLVHAAIATGQPADAIYKMGSDPELLDRLMRSDPVTRGVELYKVLAPTAPAAPGFVAPTISGAPRPPTPTTARASAPAPSLDDENTSMEEWVRIREAQLAERKRAANGRA